MIHVFVPISVTRDRLLVLKLLALVFGCMAKFITGSLFTFNVYQNDIKATFNYTQKEVEVMSSMLNIGLGVGFLPGMFYDRFGPQWASAIGLVVSVGAYMLLWSTTRSGLVHFYSKNAWLMSIYFFTAGLGSVFTYMVALNTNIINFDQKHTGKVVGLLNAFFAGSPSIFAELYYHVFKHGDSHDYPGFLLMFAVSFGIADLLCIIFVRVYKETNQTADTKRTEKADDEKEGFEYKKMENTNAKIQESSGDYSAFPRFSAECTQATTPLPLKKILLNLDYHILVWLLAFSSSVGLVYVNNVTTVSKSLCTTVFENVENVSVSDSNTTGNSTTTCLSVYDDRLTIIIPITNAVISLSVGLFSDYFKAKLPRLWILIFGCTCFLISQIIVLSLANKIFFLMLATVFAGIAIGIIWSLAPTVMKEMFFEGNLGRNWGIAILVAALLGFGMQELYGALYDAKITIPGSKDCFGMECIRGGVTVCLVSACLSIVFGVWMQLKKTCSKSCEKAV